MKKLTLILPVLIVSLFVLSNNSHAGFTLGEGPGCSAIGGLDATTIQDNDDFYGILNCNSLYGYNCNNGKGHIDDPDEDGIHSGLEECVNDSLVGYCLDIDRDDTGCIATNVIDGEKNRVLFDLSFVDSGCCGISECSDKVDNEGSPDGLVDYPDDPDCASYSDADESTPGEQGMM